MTDKKDANSLFDLSGKVAVITGGSRGLGLQMAWAYARAGANVVIASRKVENCKTVAAEIQSETGQECVGVGCHAAKWEECDRLFEAAYAKFDHIDILVNNAGMSPIYDSVLDVTEDLFDKVLNVNLRGPFRLSSLFGTRMAEGNGGSIINVSSTASVQPTANVIPYSGAKAGLNAMTVGFSRALAPKVRVNAIMPGPFLTDISKAWDMEAFNKSAKKSIPLQRGGEPEEIIGAALYLASDASSYTTGSIIKIDGGSAFAPA